MRVKLIQESSGFGCSGGIVNWIVESDENLGKIQKLSNGNVVEIPEKIAKSIYNLVNVETGEVISYKHSLSISKDEVLMRYKEHGKEEITKTRENLKETLISRIKPLESEDDSIIKTLNDEEDE